MDTTPLSSLFLMDNLFIKYINETRTVKVIIMTSTSAVEDANPHDADPSAASLNSQYLHYHRH
jgi:hypothetical protein